jgi:hypothetical protein
LPCLLLSPQRRASGLEHSLANPPLSLERGELLRARRRRGRKALLLAGEGREPAGTQTGEEAV